MVLPSQAGLQTSDVCLTVYLSEVYALLEKALVLAMLPARREPVVAPAKRGPV